MTRRAFLVGINTYPGAPLQGCVNDVAMLRVLLTERLGFLPNNIVTLEDAQATTAAMRAGLQDLVGNAADGDVLFFGYSGHGAQVRDTNGDEGDHYDEVLVPHDFDWSPSRMITDDDIRHGFSAIPARVNLTFSLDCCHSGTFTRAGGAVGQLYPPTPRRLLPDSLALHQLPVSGWLGRWPWRRRPPSLPIGRGLAHVHTPLILSACEARQTSADAYISGAYHGAHTWALDQAIRSLPPNAPVTEVRRWMRRWLRTAHYEQVPRLAGWPPARHRSFLAAP